MTILQAIALRHPKGYDADEVDEDPGNISIGSMGGLHELRDLCKLHTLLYIPR